MKVSKLILTPYAVKIPEKSGKEPGIYEYEKVGEEFTMYIEMKV